MSEVRIDPSAQHAVPASSDDAIPILDLGPYLAGEQGALPPLARALREACEDVGFYFVINHGIPRALIERTFEQARRVLALSPRRKRELQINEHIAGYMGLGEHTTRSSRVNLNTKPNLNEAYMVDREDEHGSVNQWPDGLPGFREAVIEYCTAVEQLARTLLPAYAVALDLAPDFLDGAFEPPQYTLRMSRYPPQLELEENEFGSAPHTDSSFFTLLPQSELPGLAIRPRSGKWIETPNLPDAFLVNTGDLGHRWTNERFLSTPHRVINANARDRYAVVFFFDVNPDFVMECLPSCHSPENPPRYPPTTYREYLGWFNRNYAEAVAIGAQRVDSGA